MADATDVVFGFHAVEQLLARNPRTVRRVLLAVGRKDGRVSRIKVQAEAAGIRVEMAERRVLDRMTRDGEGRAAHQGVIAECHAVTPATEAEFEARWSELERPLLLVLDGVEDPRNLGACLRSADAAGVDAVLVPRRHSAPFSTVVRKTASGALESLFIVQVANLARRLDWLREHGVWIVGADDSAERAYTDVDYTVPTAVVIGGEGSGMRRLTSEKCDYLVSIPMRGAVSSLNVSVATGVLLFECLRQRGQ